MFQKGPEDPSLRDSEKQADDLSDIPLTSGPLSAEALKKAKTDAAEKSRLLAECKAEVERKAKVEADTATEAARKIRRKLIEPSLRDLPSAKLKLLVDRPRKKLLLPPPPPPPPPRPKAFSFSCLVWMISPLMWMLLPPPKLTG